MEVDVRDRECLGRDWQRKEWNVGEGVVRTGMGCLERGWQGWEGNNRVGDCMDRGC